MYINDRAVGLAAEGGYAVNRRRRARIVPPACWVVCHDCIAYTHTRTHARTHTHTHTHTNPPTDPHIHTHTNIDTHQRETDRVTCMSRIERVSYKAPFLCVGGAG